MATTRSLPPVLLLCVAAVLPTSDSSLVKVPGSHAAAGVFMLVEGGRYTLNFTAATAACQLLNVTIATRAQLERALQQGLETCKFGWIHEKFAVVPRLKSDQNCGKGRTGLVPWFVSEDREFAVYCFNASDLERTPEASTVHPRTSMFSTTLTARTRAFTPTKAPMTSASTRPASVPTDPAEQTPVTSSFAALVKTARSAGPSPAVRTAAPSSTHIPTSPPLSTSEPGIVTVAPSTVEPKFPQSVNSAARPLAVPTGLVGAALLLAAAAALYRRRNFFRLRWNERRDYTEAEMWAQADSELDLHGREEEEEEQDLHSQPGIKTNSSEQLSYV